MLPLAPLYDKPILHSKQRVESHRLIANELSDYRLGWHNRADVDTCVRRLCSPNMALYSMEYGDEVDIYPQLYNDFILMHYSRVGSMEITTDGQRESLAEGQIALSAPRRSVALRWSAGSEQVILRVPLALLRHAQALRRAPDYTSDIAPFVRLGRDATQVWMAQLEAYAGYTGLLVGRGGAVEVSACWLAHTEHAMAAFLAQQFCCATSADTESMAKPSKIECERRRSDRLERWQRVCASLLREPATLSTLAQRMALSPRQLTEWTNQQCGLSPMAWLRMCRLDAVRAALLMPHGRDVTSVALEHGFGHLGRFSRVYHERFGEYPSQTRASCEPPRV